MTFNEETDFKMHKNLNLTYTDDKGIEKYKLMKLVGKNMQYEKDPQPSESRSSSLFNVLVFIIMDIDISE